MMAFDAPPRAHGKPVVMASMFRTGALAAVRLAVSCTKNALTWEVAHNAVQPG